MKSFSKIFRKHHVAPRTAVTFDPYQVDIDLMTSLEEFGIHLYNVRLSG